MTDYANLVYTGGQQQLTAPQQKAAGLDYAEAVYAAPSMGVSDARASGRVDEPTVVLPGRSAGFAAGFKGNIPSDPAVRIPEYAKALFPNDPKAVERFGVVQGKIVYRGNDGSLYDAEGGASTKAGAALAMAPEVIGGVVGSLFGSPVVGGSLGATAGRAGKSMAANLIFGEKQTPGGVAQDLATEATVNAVGGGVAKGAGAWFNRGAMSGAERFNRPLVAAKIADTEAKTGIRLDFSQAADVPELRMWKRFAAEQPNEASEIVAKLDAQQVGQIESAFADRLLPSLSANADSALGATKAIDTAKGIIEAAKAKRAEAVKPLYDAAYAEFERKGFVKGQVVAEFKKDPVLAMAIAGVERDPVLRRELMKQKGNSLAMLDLAKQKIDDMIGAATRAGENNRARLLMGAKEKLTSRLDELSPSYAKARGQYEQLTRDSVEPLTKGLVGTLSKIEGPHKVKAVADFVKGLPQSPAQVNQLRAMFQAKDPEAWGGMVRLSIEKTLDRALKDTSAGEVSAKALAGRLRGQLYGTPQQRAVFAAALGKDAGAADEIFNALGLIAKDYAANSATVPKALIVAEAGKPGAMQSAATAAATGINPLAWSNALENWGSLVRTGEAAKAIANALSDPAKVQALRQLRRVSDPQQRAMQMLGVIGAQATAGALSSGPKDQPPPQL